MKKITKEKKNFAGWKGFEITAYVFQDDIGRREIDKLVRDRIKDENIMKKPGGE